MITHSVLYMADVNAKADEWHSGRTDEKGEIVLEALEEVELNIANKAGNPPTYVGHNGRETNIDVTAAGGRVLDRLRNWQVLDQAINADHNIIRFDINIEKGGDRVSCDIKAGYALKRAHWDKMRKTLSDNAPVITGKPKQDAKQITKWIGGACVASIPNARTKSLAEASWWDEAAERKKKAYKRAKRKVASAKTTLGQNSQTTNGK